MLNRGSKVRILRIQDGLGGGRTIQKVGEVGLVQDYKIGDGMKLAYIVEFKDGVRSWFFADEVEVAK